MPETLEQRKSKCQTKFHHALIETNRALKKAVTFEIQKLTKRIKIAVAETDDSKPLSRVEDELRAVKALSLEGLAAYYLRHSITKNHKELCAALDIKTADTAPHRNADDSTKNVVARLFGSRIFQSSITSSIIRMEEILGVKVKVVSQSKADAHTTTKLSKKTSPKNAIDNIFQASTSSAHSSEEDQEGANNSDTDSSCDDGPVSQRAMDSQPDPSKRASTFLPSLQSGYLPALNDSDDEGELKGLFPAQKKERKNRRGQRARRKILEAKHGNKANHIIKEREAAQKEYEERVARRAAKEAERTGSNAIAIEEAEKNRRERREAMLRPIHGSWAVAKAQKQKMLQAKPLGTKISFD